MLLLSRVEMERFDHRRASSISWRERPSRRRHETGLRYHPPLRHPHCPCLSFPGTAVRATVVAWPSPQDPVLPPLLLRRLPLDYRVSRQKRIMHTSRSFFLRLFFVPRQSSQAVDLGLRRTNRRPSPVVGPKGRDCLRSSFFHHGIENDDDDDCCCWWWWWCVIVFERLDDSCESLALIFILR